MRKNNIEEDIAEYTSIAERGYATLIANSGKIIAAITALVAALVTFTDISFLDLSSAEFTSSLLVLLISSYLIYFSLEDAGERLGRESKEYLSSAEKYNAARKKIEPDDTPRLREYTVRYSKDELEYRIKAHLCRHGYSFSEYTGYLIHGCADKRAEAVFKRASKMKIHSLTPRELLSAVHTVRAELVRPDREKIFSAVTKLLPSTLCMIFTASLILTTKSNLTPSLVIESLLKLSALPVIGFRAYVSGFNYSREHEASWLETKARILEGFLKERDNLITESERKAV
ncbi:MAG: hypothetical protein J6Q85_03395 [Clostridia bacterium]|nr:hypothetical protein [Clostridia bacterium]